MGMDRERIDKNTALRQIEKIFDDVNEAYFEGKIQRPGFRLSARMRKAGEANLDSWQMGISISYHNRYGWTGELRNTIKHEAIHFYLRMTGRPAGHNRDFKEIMRRIGCTLHAKPNGRPFKYIFQCPYCRKEYRTRKWIGERYSCGQCSQGTFNKGYVLRFKRRLT